MFGWEFPPHNSGGLGTACLGLARAMVEEGLALTFVLPKRLGVVNAPFPIFFADIPNLKARAVNSLLYPYVTSEAYTQVRRQTGSSFYGDDLVGEVLSYGERASIIADETDFDVIHAHDWLAYPAGWKAKERSGKPLVVHVHATEFDRTGGANVNQRVYEIEKEGMQRADRVVAISRLTRNQVVRHYGIDSSKVVVVHNGIDWPQDDAPALPALCRWRERGYGVVLFVGRITLQKGPDYFVAAAKRVLELNPKVYFVVAGSGDMEAQTIRQAAALGIADKMMFAGFVRGRELAALYRAADVYVLPSISEPFGLTPLESLTYGTPVIISKQSGVAEVLRHALKVDFWDIEEMANQIISVLRYRPLRQTLSHNGHAETKSITWRATAQKCRAIYNILLGQPATT